MMARKGWTFSLEMSRIMAMIAMTNAMMRAMPVIEWFLLALFVFSFQRLYAFFIFSFFRDYVKRNDAFSVPTEKMVFLCFHKIFF